LYYLTKKNSGLSSRPVNISFSSSAELFVGFLRFYLLLFLKFIELLCMFFFSVFALTFVFPYASHDLLTYLFT